MLGGRDEEKVFHSPVEILVTGWSREMGLDLVFRIR